MHKKKKKVVFETEEDLFANFKIRLNFEKVRQKEFFNYIMECYTNNNEHIRHLINQLKKNIARVGKRKIAKTQKEIAQGLETQRLFNLSEKERENIFDLIEEEFGEDEF